MRRLLLKLLALGMALALLGLQAVSEGYAIKHRHANPAGYVLSLFGLAGLVLYLTLALSRPYFKKWGISQLLSPASLAPDDYKADVAQEAPDGLADKATVLENEEARPVDILRHARP